MNQFHSNSSLREKVDGMWEFNSYMMQSLVLLRWLGYGFLLLFFFDLIEMLYPAQLMNPVWEFETFGQLVERVPIPLMGFVLIHLGGKEVRHRRELPFLKCLSWMTLGMGLVFFLSSPLAIVDTVRITNNVKSQFTSQLELQKSEANAQVQAVKDRLEQVQTYTAFNSLVNQSDLQEQFQEIESDIQLDGVKTEMIAFVNQRVATMETEARRGFTNQRRSLLKSSIKWNLGALVSGVLFFILWRRTTWARRKPSRVIHM